MTTADAVEFHKIMKYLSIYYPINSINSDTVYVYFDALSEYKVEDIYKAVKLYIKKETKFPSVSELISYLCRT